MKIRLNFRLSQKDRQSWCDQVAHNRHARIAHEQGFEPGREAVQAFWFACVRSACALLLIGTLMQGASAQSFRWTLAKEQVVFPTAQAPGGEHGRAVSIDGDFLAVGNPDFPSASAYIYQFTAGSWNQQAILVLPGPPTGTSFGCSVSLSNDTLAVGASTDNTMGSAAGACYVYLHSQGAWNLQAAIFASDAATADFFGGSVSLDGDSLLVGAFGDDDAGPNSGSTYVFTRTLGIWSQQAKLVANDAQAGDLFGLSAGLEGDVAIMGAPYDDDQGLDTGSVYSFRRTGQGWAQQAKLLSPSPHQKDYFGSSLAVSSGTVLVGTPAAFSRQVMGYCFVSVGNNWVLQAKLRPVGPTSAWPSGQDGVSVDLDGDRAIIGVPSLALYGHYPFPVYDAGGAFVFERQGLTWHQIGNVTREPIIGNTGLGNAVSISGERFVTGILNEPYPMGNFSFGAAAIYKIVPAPVTYCTAKLNSLGCLPVGDFRGIPSAGSLTGFQLLCTEVLNNQPGLLIYSTNGRGNFPFQGGTLCLASPLRRATAQNSYGSPAPTQDCSGVYTIDWSGFAAGLLGGSPSAALRVPGTRVQSQWWGRDPGFQPGFNTTLSDALEFTICP